MPAVQSLAMTIKVYLFIIGITLWKLFLSRTLLRNVLPLNDCHIEWLVAIDILLALCVSSTATRGVVFNRTCTYEHASGTTDSEDTNIVRAHRRQFYKEAGRRQHIQLDFLRKLSGRLFCFRMTFI